MEEVGVGAVYCWNCNWNYLHHIYRNNTGNRHRQHQFLIQYREIK